MNITQEKVDGLNAVLKVEIEEKDYAGKVNQFLKKQQQTAQMQGFRPGKVPFSLIKKMYGVNAKVEEIQKSINEGIFKFIEEEKIDVLGQPLPKEDDELVIDWDNQKDFSFQYEIGLSPEFDVKLTAKKKFTAYNVVPDEKLLDNYAEEITMRYGTVGTGDEVEEKDIVVSDVAELENGEVKEGGIAKLANIAVERCAKGFKKQLLGAKPEAVFTVKADELYDGFAETATLLEVTEDELKAANAEFQVKVVSISRMQPAELNQELFDKVYGEGTVSSVEEFREKLAEEAKNMLAGHGKNKLKNEVVDYLLDSVKFDLPDEFLKKFIQATSKEPVSLEDIEQEYEQHSNAFRWQLIENKIIETYNLKVEESEVKEKAKEMIAANFKQFGQEVADADLETYAATVLAKQEERQRMYNELFSDKILETVKENCKVEEEEISFDAFTKLK